MRRSYCLHRVGAQSKSRGDSSEVYTSPDRQRTIGERELLLLSLLGSGERHIWP